MLNDVIEDQLTFSSRVTGIDEAGDILALDQASQLLKTGLRLFDRTQSEMWRNHGQVRK